MINKFFFSFCHLDKAVIFKDLTDDDILEVQKFVRERLLIILKSRKGFHTTESELIKYFGENYASRTM